MPRLVQLKIDYRWIPGGQKQRNIKLKIKISIYKKISEKTHLQDKESFPLPVAKETYGNPLTCDFCQDCQQPHRKFLLSEQEVKVSFIHLTWISVPFKTSPSPLPYANCQVVIEASFSLGRQHISPSLSYLQFSTLIFSIHTQTNTQTVFVQ